MNSTLFMEEKMANQPVVASGTQAPFVGRKGMYKAFAASLTDVASREATGRDAAVCGAYAPRPVASPPILGHTETPEANLSS